MAKQLWHAWDENGGSGGGGKGDGCRLQYEGLLSLLGSGAALRIYACGYHALKALEESK